MQTSYHTNFTFTSETGERKKRKDGHRETWMYKWVSEVYARMRKKCGLWLGISSLIFPPLKWISSGRPYIQSNTGMPTLVLHHWKAHISRWSPYILVGAPTLPEIQPPLDHVTEDHVPVSQSELIIWCIPHSLKWCSAGISPGFILNKHVPLPWISGKGF